MAGTSCPIGSPISERIAYQTRLTNMIIVCDDHTTHQHRIYKDRGLALNARFGHWARQRTRKAGMPMRTISRIPVWNNWPTVVSV